MQAELTTLRREVFRRQTLSFKDSRSRSRTDNIASGAQQRAVDARQQELEQQASELQHLQQEVLRLRQERDAARLQISNTASKQAVNRKSGGVLVLLFLSWMPPECLMLHGMVPLSSAR